MDYLMRLLVEKKELINYSVVVFVFMIIMGVIIGVIDFAAGELVNLIVKL